MTACDAASKTPILSCFVLPFWPVAVAVVGLALSFNADATDARGAQFFGWKDFSAFTSHTDADTGLTVFLSPVIRSRVEWNELVVSWNLATSPDGSLKIEARAIRPGHDTKFYVMGLWSDDPARHPRESVLNQADDDGDVRTDTLVLKRPATALQLRVTLAGATPPPRLKFLGVSLLDSRAHPRVLRPNRAAWGNVIPVPERSQMTYEGGGVWCSPTTVSMLLGFWSDTLRRPELDHPVPEVARAVHDAKWVGTGNWPFNMAYAGSFPGLRAYVTRFTDVAELETWIAEGVPVGLSVCYDRLRGKGRGPNGHLVVCVGFTMDGDPIVNDPGTLKNTRKVFPRAKLIDAWAYSHNTVYLIYPENTDVPLDKFGHWDSITSRRRLPYNKAP